MCDCVIVVLELTICVVEGVICLVTVTYVGMCMCKCYYIVILLTTVKTVI